MKNHSKKPLKIAVIGYKLAEGGLERVFGNTTKMLQENDVDVHTLVLENNIKYEFGGKLISFGNYSKFIKYFKLRNYLHSGRFDYIIDFRHRINPKMEWLFLHFIYRNLNTIYTIHSSYLENYLTTNKEIALQILNKVSKIIVVSHFLKEKIASNYNFNSVEVIPNSFKKTPISTFENLTFDYIIAVGRLVPLKQFDKLIESYSKSILPENNIHLIILGKGEEKQNLEFIIKRLNLKEKVHLLGFRENVAEFITKAKFLVLSSQYEGFPMTILEALSAGTPVVSFDCESGPNEMIINNKNGILVKNQNFEELTHKMNTFVEDEILFQICKNNAIESVAKFHSNVIVKQWLNILNSGN